MAKPNDDVIDVPYILRSFNRYGKFEKSLEDEISNDFSVRHDSVTLKLADTTVKTTKGALLFNLFFMYFYVETKENITAADIYSGDFVTQKIIDGRFDYFEKHVIDSGLYDNAEFCKRAAFVLDRMNSFSTISTVLAGYTIDHEDFLEAARDPEAARIFQPAIPKKAQYTEIEQYFKQTGTAINDFYSKHMEYAFSPFVRSESGVNLKQCTQTLSFVGLKPNIATGHVIPHVIKDNFMSGLSTVENYFINAEGTRGALCTNYKYTRASGYNNRKLSLLMVDTWHDDTIDDCGTQHYITYDIDSKAKLRLIDGRNYYSFLASGKADSRHLKEISYADDSALVGTKIALRSPVCCCTNSSENRVCSTCYGKKLSHINRNIHTGLVAVLEINSVLTQTLLSAKHLLSTSTDKIPWQDVFLKDFTFELDEIYFNEEAGNVVLSFDAPTEDDYDEDRGMYAITKFSIVDDEHRKPIELDALVPMYVSPSLIDGKTGTIKIYSEQAGTDTAIFTFVPHNNMLTRKLMDVIDLLENNDHLGITTVDELVNKFADLLIANGMGDINLIHAEMICSKLIKDNVSNKFIDWSKKDVPPYHINRVSKSIQEGPLSVSLSFERLNDQFENIATYTNAEKQRPSIMDYQFI